MGVSLQEKRTVIKEHCRLEVTDSAFSSNSTLNLSYVPM